MNYAFEYAFRLILLNLPSEVTPGVYASVARKI